MTSSSPPQETEITEDNSRTIDHTPGYSMYREDVVRTFDESQVTGHLRVAYGDADSRIAFSVTDVKGDSVVPDEARTAFEALSAAGSIPAR